jgi:hypothetical protein
VTHVYVRAGSYLVKLHATDQYGFGSNASVGIQVVSPLTVAIEAAPTVGVAPDPVAFDLAVSGGDGTLSPLWSFGDGSTSSSAAPVSHTYRFAGSYRVGLSVTDPLGETAQAGLTIRVVNGLTASLIVQPNSSVVGVPITLAVAASQGLPPYSFLWGGLPARCSAGNLSRAVCNSTSAGSYSIWVLVSDTLGEHLNESAPLILLPQALPGNLSRNGTTPVPPWVWVTVAAIGVVGIVGTLVWNHRRPARSAVGVDGRGPLPTEPEDLGSLSGGEELVGESGPPS